MINIRQPAIIPPFKSVAIALLFCAVLGPIGLLYSSLRGGIFMTLIGIVVVSSKFFFPILLVWIICWPLMNICGIAKFYIQSYFSAVPKQIMI